MTNDDPQEAERQEYQEFLKALGAHIRAMRKERGWTLRYMVIQHGFHLSAWQGYETGRFGMTLPSLIRVARSFGMHPGDLLKAVPLEAPEDSAVAEAQPPAKAVRKRIGAAKRK